MQDAVDAHAHGKPLFGRFDVNVGGIEIHRLGQQVVDELDDGRLFRQLPELPGAVGGIQILYRPLLADEFEEAVDLMVGGEAEGDRFVGVEVGEGGEHSVVQRVPGDAEQTSVPPPHQHRIVEKPLALDRRLGKESIDVQAVRKVFRIAEIGGALQLGEALQEQVFGNGAGTDQQRPQPAADGALNAERLVDVGLPAVVSADKQGGKAASGERASPRDVRNVFPSFVHSPLDSASRRRAGSRAAPGCLPACPQRTI